MCGQLSLREFVVILSCAKCGLFCLNVVGSLPVCRGLLACISLALCLYFVGYLPVFRGLFALNLGGLYCLVSGGLFA